ncbi:NAD(P)/FAD-dependent oxidoreductase [bacterium]|nr:NAD(P)/FAD-dependent oxidoreductase [bacterium]
MPAQVYKKELVKGPYDAIMIGSGIGGLSCAALMAREGKKVLIIERHYVAGGYTHTFTRKGYEWDVGVHYVGEVHRENSVLRRVLDVISDNNLKWAYMPEVYDKVFFGDECYEYVAGAKRMKEKLYSYFPNEKAAIDGYFDAVYEAAGAAKGFFGEKALPSAIAAVAGPFMRRGFLKYANQTTDQVLRSLTSNQKLIGLLSAQYGDYGLPPKQSSFAIHAMVAKHYFDGGNYPVGGSGSIAETIIPVIESAGGTVLIKNGVKKVIVKNGKATGVELDNGDIIESPMVISDAGVVNTFGPLLDEPTQEQFKLKEKLTKVNPSLAHIGLYIGFKKTSEELGLSPANLWIYPGYDHDESMANYVKNPDGPLPVTYISFPSTKDPTWNERFKNRSTIEIVGFTPYEWFKKWEGTKWLKRGDDYKEFKERLSNRLLDNLYHYVPQVKGQIDYYELSTPLSTQHFCNYQKGEIYGIDHTPERFNLKWLKPQTPVKGLYLTGQDVASVGLTGALFGGVLTASAILKKNVVMEVMKS